MLNNVIQITPKTCRLLVGIKKLKNSLFFVLIIFSVFSCKEDEEEIIVPIDNIFLSGDNPILKKGETYTFEYTLSPSNATIEGVEITSSNEDIIEFINDSTAIARNIGRCEITVRATGGSGGSNTKTYTVFDTPSVSINNVQDVTFYSAQFQVELNHGGDANAYCCMYWDTIPELDTLTCLGKSIVPFSESKVNCDLFEPDTRYYAWVFIRNVLDSIYSNRTEFITESIPEDISGNYMLNLPLAWGLVAKYNDWVYYNNYNEGYKLYRIKSDLSQKEKISDKITSVSSLNIIGSSIYLSGNMSSGYSELIKMKYDGTNLKYYGDEFYYKTWGAAIVYGNYIYPSNGYFRISLDSKEISPNIAFSNYLNIYNNKLYFCSFRLENSDSLYSINSCNLDGTGIEELYRGYNPYIFNRSYLGVYNNAVYFREKDVFKTFNLSTPNIVTILPIKPTYYNISGYTIFFANSQDSDRLYQSDLTGNLVTKLCDDSVGIISVIDDWLYYYNNSDNRLYRIKQDGTSRQLVD
jgi:hypothetical protein